MILQFRHLVHSGHETVEAIELAIVRWYGAYVYLYAHTCVLVGLEFYIGSHGYKKKNLQHISLLFSREFVSQEKEIGKAGIFILFPAWLAGWLACSTIPAPLRSREEINLASFSFFLLLQQQQHATTSPV